MTEVIHQPSRCLVGNCPSCGLVLVIFNEYEAWPLARCMCGWAGGTTDLANHVLRMFEP